MRGVAHCFLQEELFIQVANPVTLPVAVTVSHRTDNLPSRPWVHCLLVYALKALISKLVLHPGHSQDHFQYLPSECLGTAFFTNFSCIASVTGLGSFLDLMY